MKEQRDKLIKEIILLLKKRDVNKLKVELRKLFKIVMSAKAEGNYDYIASILKKIIKDNYIVDYDYWILVEYGNALYELREYKEALKIADKYIKIEPNDPYCIFHYSLILRVNREPAKAIKYLNRLYNMPLEELSFGKFGEGVREAKSLLNDTRYLLALTYFEQDNLKKSIEFYNEHIDNRQSGIPSMVTKRIVIKELKDVKYLVEYNSAQKVKHNDKR